ncbi:MAG TPA: fibronectin type III domain-containing protein, partial [Polyangia bacterium]|nr:fibronectin type III domain-containing protein [Polyangia bacterium]
MLLAAAVVGCGGGNGTGGTGGNAGSGLAGSGPGAGGHAGGGQPGGGRAGGGQPGGGQGGSAGSPDTQPPTAPANLLVTAPSNSQINLSWSASADDVGVTGYLVERCQGANCATFAQVGITATTSFQDAALTATATYSYRVRATDAAGNLGPYSTVATAITTTSTDVQAPSAPGALTATATSGSQINLVWTAATDDVGVTAYRVERCQGAACTAFAQIAAATTVTFSDTGLAAGVSYSYRVRASDGAGNLGAYSNVATATTLMADTTPPSAPSNLVATPVSGTRISLAWTASMDAVGVTGYVVERCQGAACTTFSQVGTAPGAAFTDTGLAAATAYSYRVRGTDAAMNLSAYSNVATATTKSAVEAPAYVQGNYA